MIHTFFRRIGAFILFLESLVVHIPKLPKRRYQIITQIKRMGFDSMLLITVTSAFTGMVTAVQATYQTSGYIPTELIGVMVGKSMMIELAPVLTALVLAGRVGASIAAEIGTMRVSEQLDALETLAVDPVDFLYLPRVISGIIVLPMLTIYANFVGIFSGYLVARYRHGVGYFEFFNNMRRMFDSSDLWGGMVKSLVFGFIITTIACFIGSRTENGAEGVGRASTLTVVYTSIFILLMDYIVASMLFGGA